MWQIQGVQNTLQVWQAGKNKQVKKPEQYKQIAVKKQMKKISLKRENGVANGGRGVVPGLLQLPQTCETPHRNGAALQVQWRAGGGGGRTSALIACVSLGLGLLLAVLLTVQLQAQAAFAATCAEIRSDTLRLHVVANSNAVADQTVKLQVRDAILAEMEELYQAALAQKVASDGDSGQPDDTAQAVEPPQQNTTKTSAGQVELSAALTSDTTQAVEPPQQNTTETGAAQAESSALSVSDITQADTTALTQAESVALVLANIPRLALAASQTLAAAGVQQQVSLCIAEQYFDTTVYDTFTLPAGQYTALQVTLGDAGGRNWWCVLYPSLCVASASVQEAYDTDAQNEITVGEYTLRFAVVEWWEKTIK